MMIDSSFFLASPVISAAVYPGTITLDRRYRIYYGSTLMNNFKTYRWLLFGLIGTLYFIVCLHRVSPTVIARDLALEFSADAMILGFIFSSYFYIYAGMQPVVGYFSDTAGPRKVISISFFLAAVGAFVFGTAQNVMMATVGRIVIGAGAAGVFIPALKLFSQWYRLDEFAGLTGLMLTIGGLGALAASAPLTYLVLLLGWRNTFFSIGLLSLALASFCWVIIRDTPEKKGWPAMTGGLCQAAPEEETVGLRNRMALIFGNFDFWMISLSTFFTGGAFLSFQAVWAVPYLMDVLGLSRVEAGWMLMLLPLGYAMGGPILGFLTDKLALDRRKVLIRALGFGFFGWICFMFFRTRSDAYLVAPLFFLFGMIGGGTLPICFSIIRNLFPPALMGTASGVMNMAAFFGTALYLPVSGYILKQFPVLQPGVYTFEAYRGLLIFYLISYVIAFVFTALLSKQKPSAPGNSSID
jgi:sugar phosphate permease